MDIKQDQSMFSMNLYLTNDKHPSECFKWIPKYFGEQVIIRTGYISKTEDETHTGLAGVGKDNTFPIAEFALVQISTKNNNDNDFTHKFEISFKLTGKDNEKMRLSVEFLTETIRKSFEERDLSIKDTFLISGSTGSLEENHIILPCIPPSINYLFECSGLQTNEIISKIEEAGAEWLSLLFNHDLKGNVGKILMEKIPLCRGLNGKNLLEILANNGDSMRKQSEEMVEMLVKIDEEKFGSKDGGADRVIAQLKRGLSSSSHLASMIQSVKTRYPLEIWAYRSKLMMSFFKNILKGIGVIFLDFGTDAEFTYSMWTLWTCHETLTSQNFEYGTDPCLSKKELNRFNGTFDWQCMFIGSCTHLLFPFIMYFFCSLSIIGNIGCDMWAFLSTFPVVAKIRIFCLERNLLRIWSEERSKGTKKGGKGVETKSKINDVQEILMLGLLIEASCEASFQFYFQTLYR